MRKNFLIKALSLTLLSSMLITSITPVNASTVSNDASENGAVVSGEATPAQTTEEITSEEENTEVQDEKDVSTVDENTESQDAEEITVEEETTEIHIGETNSEESGITPLWLNPDHRDAQWNYVISQLGLNSNQASWLKEGATAPDSYYSETKGFHARKNTNYMACLKAIFMYAQLIGNNDSGQSKKQIILNSMPNISSGDKENISLMVQNMNTFIDGKGSTSVNQRKYIAYGFGLHLAGDIFAHRVMVKVANLNNWGTKDTSSNKYLQDRDFIQSQIPAVKAAITANQVDTASLKEYMPANGHTWTLNTGGTTDLASRVYPDNPTFMPKRFNAAKQASVSFVQKAKNGNSFNGVDLFLDDYNLSLYRYSEHISKI